MKAAKRMAALLAVLLLAAHGATAFAEEEQDTGNATSGTYVWQAVDGGLTMSPSQDAYLTGDVLFLDAPLSAPEDVFAAAGKLYVADTGAGRVVRVDPADGAVEALGEGVLSSPTGVFVTAQGEIYVADPGRNVVSVLDGSGRLLREYGRPDGVTFGENAQYQPTKVAVADSGVIYIVSSGSFDGIIQLDQSGAFLGYYGYNNVPMSLTELVQDLIFTDEQKEQLFHKIPLSFYNLALDEKGVCYTVTQKTKDAPLKKHNVAGVNILRAGLVSEDLSDVCLGPGGQIFVVQENGLIVEMDNDGVIWFIFGGGANESERRGLFTVASGIAADENGSLYVLDRERGLVHTFTPTEYAGQMHAAVRQYRDGEYEQCLDTLQALLKTAGRTKMIHYYMGNSQLQLHNYEAAMEHFRRAGESQLYSDAFWEARTERMGRWFGWGMLAALALLAAAAAFGAARKKRKKPPVYFYTDGRRARDVGFWENLAFALRFLKHPFNCFYEVKIGSRGTAATGCTLYLLAFLSFSFYMVGQGFSFNQMSLNSVSPGYLVMLFFLPVGLFVLASYMVSEINNGEGTFGRMFVGMAYCFTPLICILPIATLLTHVLTLSEAFLPDFSVLFALAWTGVLLFLSIKEIHNYEIGQVFLNLVLSAFLMIVMIFVGSIIGMFWDTVLDTVSSVGKEVLYRVFG